MSGKRKRTSKHRAHKIADDRLAIEQSTGGYLVLNMPKGMEVIGDGWVTLRVGKTHAKFGFSDGMIKTTERYGWSRSGSLWAADTLWQAATHDNGGGIRCEVISDH